MTKRMLFFLFTSQTQQTERKVKRRNKCPSTFSGVAESQETSRGGGGQGGCCCLLLQSPWPPARDRWGCRGVGLWVLHPDRSHHAQAGLTLPPVGDKGGGGAVWVSPLSSPEWKYFETGWDVAEYAGGLAWAQPYVEE